MNHSKGSAVTSKLNRGTWSFYLLLSSRNLLLPKHSHLQCFWNTEIAGNLCNLIIVLILSSRCFCRNESIRNDEMQRTSIKEERSGRNTQRIRSSRNNRYWTCIFLRTPYPSSSFRINLVLLLFAIFCNFFCGSWCVALLLLLKAWWIVAWEMR